MGDGDDFKGCARPSHPGRGRQARSFDRFEDIHIVRLAQHGCDSRTRRMYRRNSSKGSHQGLYNFSGLNETSDIP